VSPEADYNWRQAQRFSYKVRLLDPVEFPEAVVHYSYYAIYHASLAVLLTVEGSTPTKHGSVNTAMCRLAAAREGPDEERALRFALREAYEMRLRADYMADTPIPRRQADAADIAAHRDTVLAFCDRVLADP
jgi:uncharacterized protein (UPF0332 family)